MFQCMIMVDDKNVSKVMWALDGIVVGEPQWRPVRAAKAKGNKVVSTQPIPGASIPDNVIAYFITRKVGKVISTEDIRTALAVVGARADQLPFVRKAMQDKGFIGTAIRTAGSVERTYKVLAKKEK